MADERYSDRLRRNARELRNMAYDLAVPDFAFEALICGAIALEDKDEHIDGDDVDLARGERAA